MQFRPPLEEIRSKFYREMRRFITIPLHFRGVGQGEGQLGKPQQTIFPRMIDRNAKGLLTVYRKVSGACWSEEGGCEGLGPEAKIDALFYIEQYCDLLCFVLLTLSLSVCSAGIAL